MAEFVAFESGMMVNGTTIMAIVKGMGAFRPMAIDILATAGLNDVIPDATHWYSQQAWLDAFKIISEEIGDPTLFVIGKKIPENAVFPPDIDGVAKALASIDVAYHMNHKNTLGQVLFDPTRQPPMLEGIGRYGFEMQGDTKAKLVCENPYPCHFDRGIITTMALRFSPWANVTHDDDEPCRKKGAESCTYWVTWK